jgi:hypothetical protein
VLAEIKNTFALGAFCCFIGILLIWYAQVAVLATRRGDSVWNAVARAMWDWRTAICLTFATTQLVRALVSG